MSNLQKHIILVAGEASGDLHGAHLVEELKKLDSSLYFSGLGGNKMREAGVEIYHDLTQIAVIGFVEVLKHYNEFKKIFDLFLQKVDEVKPIAVILIDYPGFNLRLAKELKKRKIKVIYYISPQVWAWKENRVAQIKQNVDHMLVLFEFEKDFYAKHGINVDFVGHPLLDIVQPNIDKDTFLKKIGFPEYRLTIGLLPGSREKEIECHLPVMLETSQRIHKEFPMTQFILVKAPTVAMHLLNEHVKDFKSPLKIVDNDQYNAINACDMCIVTSGTATLETAILQKPMVVIYKTSFLTWLLAKMVIKIPNIGLVNVVAGKRIVPECVQFEAHPLLIVKELKNIFTNELKIAEIKSELKKVRASLGQPGAIKIAARKIQEIVSL